MRFSFLDKYVGVLRIAFFEVFTTANVLGIIKVERGKLKITAKGGKPWGKCLFADLLVALATVEVADEFVFEGGALLIVFEGLLMALVDGVEDDGWGAPVAVFIMQPVEPDDVQGGQVNGTASEIAQVGGAEYGDD